MKVFFSLALLALLALSACGHAYRVDSRLEPMVQKFRELSVRYNNNQTVDNVTIDVLPHGTLSGSEKNLGWCDGAGGIQIDENVLYLSRQQQELVVFHELGHCVLGREHNSEMKNGMPASIMHPQISDAPQLYEAHPEIYWEELFH